MTTLSIPALLRRVPLFESLSEAQAKSLADSLEKVKFKRSDCLIEAGGHSDSLFIILSGEVRVVIIGDAGKEAVLATLGAGECVGEMGLLDNAPHDATVIAQTPVDVLLLNRQAFHNSINSNPALGVAVMRSLVGRLRLANQKIASLALVSVYGRVAQHLISEATANPSGELLIQKKLSPVALSRVLGASRETIGQTLKTLENQTFIERMQSGQFKINPQVLQNRSELELQIPLNVHQVNRSLMQQATVH